MAGASDSITPKINQRHSIIVIALFNACLSSLAIFQIDNYEFISGSAFFSLILFITICFLERGDILFLARTLILGVIGYFPMIIKILLGREALFSGYERLTQGFDIVTLMYITTSLALLSNAVGITLACPRPLYQSRFVTNQVNFGAIPKNKYWVVAAFIGSGLILFSSYDFISGYGATVLTASYNSAGDGVSFGSVGVLGAIGLYSFFVYGLKRRFLLWKTIFISLLLLWVVYSQLLMGVRQDAMSVLFGCIVLYGVTRRQHIGFKFRYLPLLVVGYIFFEVWGIARTALSGGIPIGSIINQTFDSIGGAGVIRMGTISPIATTFSNTVWLIEHNQLDYSYGKSYLEWILRIPPEALYPARPRDYAWMFSDYGLLAGGGFFELGEVYMNFGLMGALFIPGIISFLMAKSYYYAFYKQSMLSYFLLFSFLSVFLRGTWYQTFAFFRAFTVLTIFYFICLLVAEALSMKTKSSHTSVHHTNTPLPLL